MRLSIVIPVLYEAAGIAHFLHSLQPLRHAGHELIVVDGGSSDATLEHAAPLTDQIIRCARGRAQQMNAGAERKEREIGVLHERLQRACHEGHSRR